MSYIYMNYVDNFEIVWCNPHLQVKRARVVKKKYQKTTAGEINLMIKNN